MSVFLINVVKLCLPLSKLDLPMVIIVIIIIIIGIFYINITTITNNIDIAKFIEACSY